MAVIREYSAPENLGIRTTESGITSAARSAAGVQRAYDEAARAKEESGRQIGGAIAGLAQISEGVDKLEEHREVSVGAAALAKMHAEATTQWNEAAKKADPNDPTLGPKFLQEKLEPNLETFREGFNTQGGQKWADARIAAFRDHMTQKVAADQATMAGQAIAVNLEKTRNNLSATVRSDPTSVGESLKIYESAVDKLIETSPMLTGVQASKVRTDLLQHGKSEIVKSSLIGLAAINPEAAMAAVESGKYGEYISGAEAKAIVANAKQQIRAERTDQQYARHLQDQQRKDVSEAAENEIIKDLYSDNPRTQSKVSAKSIVNDDRLTNPTKEKLIRMVESEMKPQALSAISQRNTVELFRQMRTPDGMQDTRPIDDAYIDGKINRGDHDWLRKEFLESRTPEGQRLNQTKSDFFKAVAPQIDKSNPLMGKLDQDGKMNLYRLEWDVNRKIEEYRKTGKNPYDLFDSSKPDFVGKPSAILEFQKPLSESIKDQARRLGVKENTNLTGPGKDITGISVEPAPPPVRPLRKSGESPDAYLKRIGAQ